MVEPGLDLDAIEGYRALFETITGEFAEP